VYSRITFTPSEVSAYYAERVPQLNQRPGANEWRGPCPVHRGTDDNFAVNASTGEASCFSQCGCGWDLLSLEQALTGKDFKTAKAEIFRIVGRSGSPKSHRPSQSGRIVATYDYTDEAGRLLYQAVRMEPKRFWQQRPDGNEGWIKDLKGAHLVLYRLPELLKRGAEIVYICEGEKDVETLESYGLLATCNPMGAGKWRPEYSETLRDRVVVILPDNDDPGRKDAAAKAASLLGVAASVRIVELPGLPAKGDVTDWWKAGGTLEKLRELTEAASPPLDATALSMLCAQWGITDKEPKYVAARAKKATAASLTTRCLSDIEAKPVCWLWRNRIARGKLTIIAGNPGLGKSQITASIASVVTNGGRWPAGNEECEPGDVIFLSAEDDPADTLRPRLEAAGADLKKVHIVDGVDAGCSGRGNRSNRTFSLQADIQALGLKLAELGNVALVVIDPITAYLGDIDSHKTADVRGLLAPLCELASIHNTAIIGVSHLNKTAGAQALMRVTGSVAFVAAARAAYLVTTDPLEKTRRLLLPIKNNLGPDATGLAFRIEGAIVSSAAGTLETSRACWESEPISMTADEAIQAESASRSMSAVETAKAWLQDALSNGPLAKTELDHLAKEEGIANRTLQRASTMLRIRKVKAGMTDGWRWSLPPKVAKLAEHDHVSELATFAGVGNLREPGEGMAEVEL
jgi:putative DNA primase/helicase